MCAYAMIVKAGGKVEGGTRGTMSGREMMMMESAEVTKDGDGD